MGMPRDLQARLESYGFQADGTQIDQAASESIDTSDAVAAQATQATQEVQGESVSPPPEEAFVTTENIGSETSVITEEADSTSTVEEIKTSSSETPDANYKRMEGRYKAQIKRLEDQLTESKEQARGTSGLVDMLAAMREELTTLRTNKAADMPPPAEPEIPELTAEESEMFGDFAPVADKLIAKATAPLKKEIADLKARTGEVDERVGKNSEAMFVSHVRARVPDFDQAVQHPEWENYLSRSVPFTHLTMKDALGHAHEARDLERVVGIFNAFAQDLTPSSSVIPPVPNRVAAQTAQPVQTSAPKNNLAQFATPDRTTANPTSTALPRYRQSDWDSKQKDMRANRISKPELEQFMKDFIQAKRQGLVA